MDKKELEKEMAMPYTILCDYLKEKYGDVPYDYYVNQNCRTKNKKNSRYKEGLVTHHMDEDKGIRLSKPYQACNQPYEWQAKERLLYCNHLEHLLLHLKISIAVQKKRLYDARDIANIDVLGVTYICKDFNLLYGTHGETESVQRYLYPLIEDNYDDYIFLMSVLVNYMKSIYRGNIEERDPAFEAFIEQFLTVYDGIDIDWIKKDMKAACETYNKELAELLAVDFTGLMFPEYADLRLDLPNCKHMTLDEYLTRAFPVKTGYNSPAENEEPVLWIGKKIPWKARKAPCSFVRIKTAFTVKDGEQPFVYVKDSSLFHPQTRSSFPTKENNRSVHPGWILNTTALINARSGRIVSPLKKGDSRYAVEITLTLGDFKLFKKKYDITYCEILDGCYFKKRKVRA